MPIYWSHYAIKYFSTYITHYIWHKVDHQNVIQIQFQLLIHRFRQLDNNFNKKMRNFFLLTWFDFPSRWIVILSLLPLISAETVRHDRSGERLLSMYVIFKCSSPSKITGCIVGSAGVSRKYDNAFALLIVLNIPRKENKKKKYINNCLNLKSYDESENDVILSKPLLFF